MASTEQNKLAHTENSNNDPNTTKLNYNFIFKALIVTLFLIILPIFPSQALPEFINSQALFTTTWELLHLLFVGIAISYGLFSRRNDEPEPEPEPDKDHQKDPNNNNHHHHAQSYVSRFLHVSSVFDDEPESPPAEGKKVQAWSSQYHREDPVVVLDGGERPLLLPVRSLKETSNNKPNESGSTLVLPSPIPWRSRSETKVESSDSLSSNSRSQSSSRFSRPESYVSESQAKVSEDFLRKKKKTDKPIPPPPPPPPPPPLPMKSSGGYGFPTEKSVRPVKRFESEKKSALDQTVVKGTNFKELPKEREDFVESDMDESESEEEEEDESETERSFVQRDMNGKNEGENIIENEESCSVVSSVNGDVDKKAGEFIAKFREQIRLQRIESIKRSTAQMSKKIVR